ncbi:MAG: hypothetical protein ABSB76_25840 [Streptosporangiaceae bacterium]|jgi:hypothetical protein
MVKHLTILWKRLSRVLTADPGRFAGGSAVDDPLGLLAVEQEALTRLPRARRDAGPADGRR